MASIIVGVYLHLLLSVDIEFNLIWLLPPVVWSSINFGEVIGYFIIHLNFVLKRLHVTMFVLPLDLCYYRVVPLNLEERVSFLVELFHLPISHQHS